MLDAESDAADSADAVTFDAGLRAVLARRRTALEAFCAPNDLVGRRVLEEYGAMFLAGDAVMLPPACVFKNAAEVAAFQQTARMTQANIAGTLIELQPAAMEALLAARAEAQKRGLEITPRGGAEAARRSYEDTLRLWASRVEPALDFWQARKRLAPETAARVRSLPTNEQVRAVLEMEAAGLFFSKDFSKTILRSVAAPGTSQHLAMLAFDVAEFTDVAVRRILAHHGWFQTVQNDLPHFTFLGLPETNLPARGLRLHTEANGQAFWLPNVC